MGLLEESESSARAALEQSPDDPWARVELAITLEQSERIADALGELMLVDRSSDALSEAFKTQVRADVHRLEMLLRAKAG